MGDLPAHEKFSNAVNVSTEQLLVERVGIRQRHRPAGWRLGLRIRGEREGSEKNGQWPTDRRHGIHPVCE